MQNGFAFPEFLSLLSSQALDSAANKKQNKTIKPVH